MVPAPSYFILYEGGMPYKPCKSLVKSICYPLELSFSRKETDWGLNYEKIARNLYFKKLQSMHEDLVIADSGLVFNPHGHSLLPLQMELLTASAVKRSS